MQIYFKNGSMLKILESTECTRGKVLLNKEYKYMNYLKQVFAEYIDKMIETLDKESENMTMDIMKQGNKIDNMKVGEVIFDENGFHYYTNAGIKMDLKNINLNDIDGTILIFEEIVPEKVVVVYFGDGQSEKMVCREPDVFDLHRCLYLAIAKHLYKKEYTTEGIEYKASELSMQKRYVKIVENAIKAHNKMLKDQEKSEKLELERVAAKNRRLQKKREKREQAKEIKREETIEIQKEAYIRAMREYKSDKKKEK